jgi:hypothetical protein
MVKSNFDHIVFRTKEEADTVVEAMSNLLERFKVVYLGDLKDLVGLETSYIDQKWAWLNLDGIKISEVSDGFSIDLPPMEEV